jgi:predicted chitinase
MRATEFVAEDLSRRGFLGGLAAAAVPGVAKAALSPNTDYNDDLMKTVQKKEDPLGYFIQNELSEKDKKTIAQVQQRVQAAMHAAPVPRTTHATAKPAAYKPITGSTLETALHNFAVKMGITGIELAAFMGQTAHESNNFKTTKEYASGEEYEGRRDLGNTQPGDGPRYKGRGFIQLTGRYNYAKAGKDLGIDLINHPELAERPDVAAKVTWWYWKNKVRPNVRNFGDVRQVTKTINPALRGLDQRTNATKDFKVAQR